MPHTIHGPSGLTGSIRGLKVRDPILDPTLTLETGRAIVVPATRILTDVILSETRRREHG